MNESTIMFNKTCPEDGRIEELPLGPSVKVIGILSYFLGRLGNFLLLGIVHYEKFGQDPQKRSLSDRLFTFWFQLFTSLMANQLCQDRYISTTSCIHLKFLIKLEVVSYWKLLTNTRSMDLIKKEKY